MEGACQYLPLLNVCLLAPIFASCHQWASSFVSLQSLFGLAPIDTHHLFLPFFLFLLSLLFFNSFPPLSLSLFLSSIFFFLLLLCFSLLIATPEGNASENKKRFCKISFPTVQRCMGCCQQEVGAKCTNFILFLSDYNS